MCHTQDRVQRGGGGGVAQGYKSQTKHRHSPFKFEKYLFYPIYYIIFLDYDIVYRVIFFQIEMGSAYETKKKKKESFEKLANRNSENLLGFQQ